jgi:hypothetical protein
MENLDEKNVPTNPSLWSQAKSLARSKFDVYPSAYANGWASKWYKGKGGSWKSVSEAKEESEYDYEGDMARGQLQSIINNAQRVHDMLKDKDNLPEWVQSKITLAEDYISTVANYMMSELDEEVMQESIQDEPHEIVHKETGKTVSTHKNYKDAYSAYQDLVKASDHAIGHISKKTNEAVSHEPWKDKTFGPTKVIQQKYKVKTDTKTYNVKAETEAHAHKLVSNHAPGSKIVSIEHKGRIMEEVKPITELSADTLDRYKEKAKKSSDSLTGQGKYRQANDRTMNVMKATGKQINKTVASIRKALNREEVVQEGRPSQRHPLEGHEYHKKSNDALVHIAKDAHAAAEAMKSHNTTAENKYRDQASDSATVRYFRQKNGMPEWYKKKYGHVKESVVNEVMDEPNYSSSIQARQKKAEVAKKTDAGTPAQLSLKATPKKLETPVYESRQLEIVREAMADAKKKDAAKKKEQKVNPGGDDKFQADPELTSSITKNAQ